MSELYLPHFTVKELACPATGIIKLAPGFGDKLEELRKAFNNQMLISSGCRSKAHNEEIGGHKRSLHVYDLPWWPTEGTAAVDVLMRDSMQKGELFALAWSLGWSVGVNKRFLHLDRRSDYTSLLQTLFTY